MTGRVLRGLFAALEKATSSLAVHLLHHVTAGAGQQVGRAVQGDEFAVVDDAHPVAQGLGLLDVMSGEHDGDSRLVAAADQVPDAAAGLSVKAHGGLVQKQHLGFVQKGPGDHQAALEATGKTAHHILPALVQAHELQQLVYALFPVCRGHVVQHAVQLQIGVDA